MDQAEQPLNHLELTVNGRRVVESHVSPTMTLLQYLRGPLGLTGTKEGCAEGDCGACTVALVDPSAPGGPAYRAVNSCLVLLPMVQGQHVVTVEGLGGSNGPHPVQSALVDALGSQCGYCTPGVVMSMFEGCYRPDVDAPWKLDDQMCGNLCRCTGYRPIRDAAKAVAGARPQDRFLKVLDDTAPTDRAVDYTAGPQTFFTPSSYDALFAYLAAHADARLIAGGTDLSLEVTKRFARPPRLVSLEGIGELATLTRDGSGLHIGACVRLSDLESAVQDDLPPLARMLRFFGSRQIKHRATVGGNLCTASPIGDLAPVLLALGAQVSLRSAAGVRTVPLHSFFLGYRKTAMAADEILESVHVPPIPKGVDVRAVAYKVSKRQELDISTVSAGLWVELDDSGAVREARFAFGGMAATPSRAAHAEGAVKGRVWSEAVAEDAAVALAKDFSPIDDHRGSGWYRRTVAANLLRGFLLETWRDPRPNLPYRPSGTVVLSELTP